MYSLIINLKVSKATRVIYGGSVTEKNASDLVK